MIQKAARADLLLEFTEETRAPTTAIILFTTSLLDVQCRSGRSCVNFALQYFRHRQLVTPQILYYIYQKFKITVLSQYIKFLKTLSIIS